MLSTCEDALDSVFVLRRGDGVPLLLLNGLGAHHLMWSPFLDDLTVSTVAFDWPGMGRSPAHGRPHAMGQFVAFAEALIDRLGHTRVDVLGYSFGGAVAVHLAANRPDLVRRLVLVAPTLGWGSVIGKPMAIASLATPLRYYSPAYLKLTSRFTSAGIYEKDPEYLVRAAAVRQRYKPDTRAYYGQLLALSSSSAVPRLGDIRQPTLVVHGASDPVVPAANGYLLAHRIPRARLLLVPRAGHMLLQHRGTNLAASVSNLLEAEDHNCSATWRDAQTITDTQVHEAVRRADLRAAQPMGLMNAMSRTRYPASRHPPTR